MRPLADLGPYIHSYSKYIHLFDLNTDKWVKLNNEQVNKQYDHKNRCIYCVYDEKVKHGRKSISPRCDTDVSTRSRFFKHLQDLEAEMNKRLVCTEQELECLLKGEQSTRPENQIDLTESPIEKRDNVDNEGKIDRFLELICAQNNVDLVSAVEKSNQPDDSQRDEEKMNYDLNSSSDMELDDNSNDEQFRDPNSNDNLITSQTCNQNSDKENSIQVDCSKDELIPCPTNNSNCTESESELSQCSLNSLPLSPPFRRRRKPIVKSIYSYEKEFEEQSKCENPKNCIKHESGNEMQEYSVIVKQIIGDQTKFLCYLDQI